MRAQLEKNLPELLELERLIDHMGDRVRVAKVAEVPCDGLTLPQYAIAMGSTSPDVPVIGFFGGVHGLERIGSMVVLAYLQTVSELLRWDKSYQYLLENTRVLFMPLVNPAGTYLKIRSNANGVDLMRNAPVDAEVKPSIIAGGQRLSKRLPWYRGKMGAAMEAESKALCEFVRREAFSSKMTVTIDVHSGYGTMDRIWFPYAKTKRAFPQVAEVVAMKEILDRTFPNHVYCVEPQSMQYTTHGDLWDYLYDEHRAEKPDSVFLPFSLEMGSWIWVKKNPVQAFSILGAFNPLIPHRSKRTLRRHINFFDFLHRVTLSSSEWSSLTPERRKVLEEQAEQLWYSKHK